MRLLLCLFSAIVLVFAQSNVTVQDIDPSISFNPLCSPRSTQCSGGWFSWNFTADQKRTITYGPSASMRNVLPSAAFSFNGTAIYYYAVISGQAAAVSISIDGAAAQIVNLTQLYNLTPNSGVNYPALAYAANNLDPRKEHTFFLQFDEPDAALTGNWAGFDSIVYTPVNPSQTYTGAVAASETQGVIFTSNTSIPKHKSNNGAIIAAVFGGTLGGLLLIGGISLVVWKKFKRRPSNVPKRAGWAIEGGSHGGSRSTILQPQVINASSAPSITSPSMILVPYPIPDDESENDEVLIPPTTPRSRGVSRYNSLTVPPTLPDLSVLGSASERPESIQILMQQQQQIIDLLRQQQQLQLQQAYHQQQQSSSSSPRDSPRGARQLPPLPPGAPFANPFESKRPSRQSSWNADRKEGIDTTSSSTPMPLSSMSPGVLSSLEEIPMSPLSSASQPLQRSNSNRTVCTQKTAPPPAYSPSEPTSPHPSLPPQPPPPPPPLPRHPPHSPHSPTS